MDPNEPPAADPWDVEGLRLPPERVRKFEASRQPPRHGRGESFICGPIPYRWIALACRLPGSGLHVASTFRFLCRRYRGANRWGLEAVAEELRVSLDTARRGLNAAEMAGLLSVDREPGCKLSVSVLELADRGEGTTHRPLCGPIPWAWWLVALRLTGPALATASACWMVAGWERLAEFELSLGNWDDLGLSRFGASRGLKSLQRAGLIEVVERSGRSPIVTLLDRPVAAPGASGYSDTGANPGV
jgi:DNA-binding transcriptional ArsR family regulator